MTTMRAPTVSKGHVPPTSIGGFEIAPLEVRLERFNDTARKLQELMQQWDWFEGWQWFEIGAEEEPEPCP